MLESKEFKKKEIKKSGEIYIFMPKLGSICSFYFDLGAICLTFKFPFQLRKLLAYDKITLVDRFTRHVYS